MTTTSADRVAAFLARYERTHPNATVLWSDTGDRALSVRLTDLHDLLLGAAADKTDAPQTTTTGSVVASRDHQPATLPVRSPHLEVR